jgi:L-threonylcarbamoyladenylate synthase
LPLLDGGACRLGLESSILDARGSQPILLREGALSQEKLSAALDIQIHIPIRPEENAETVETAEPSVQSPGQLLRHYAPRHPLRLDAQSVWPGEALLAFGVPLASTGSVEQLSEREDLNEAAANLFAALHRLDALDLSGIAVMPIPQVGIGRAIYDRLKRGAA